MGSLRLVSQPPPGTPSPGLWLPCPLSDPCAHPASGVPGRPLGGGRERHCLSHPQALSLPILHHMVSWADSPAAVPPLLPPGPAEALPWCGLGLLPSRVAPALRSTPHHTSSFPSSPSLGRSQGLRSGYESPSGDEWPSAGQGCTSWGGVCPQCLPGWGQGARSRRAWLGGQQQALASPGP